MRSTIVHLHRLIMVLFELNWPKAPTSRGMSVKDLKVLRYDDSLSPGQPNQGCTEVIRVPTWPGHTHLQMDNAVQTLSPLPNHSAFSKQLKQCSATHRKQLWRRVVAWQEVYNRNFTNRYIQLSIWSLFHRQGFIRLGLNCRSRLLYIQSRQDTNQRR